MHIKINVIIVRIDLIFLAILKIFLRVDQSMNLHKIKECNMGTYSELG